MVCYGFKGGTGTASRVLTQRTRRLHRRRPGAVQLRPASAVDHRRRSGGQGDSRRRTLCRADASRTRCRERNRRAMSDPSLSWSRPMRRCCRINSSALRDVPRWVWRVPGPSRAIVPAIYSLPSPPPTLMPMLSRAPTRSRPFQTSASARCSQPLSKLPKRPS